MPSPNPGRLLRAALDLVAARPGIRRFTLAAAAVRAARSLESEVASLDSAELSVRLRRAASAIAQADANPSRPAPRMHVAEFLALARELADRSVGLRPFDQQLEACAALMSGTAVELDTGEGKTLAGALAAMGLAVGGRQVHVIAVNDYLASRDAEWMRPLFEAAGVTSASLGQDSTADERRGAYDCDITYVPIAELGFDLLRDRFVLSPSDAVHPVLDAAIVDEIDSVLVDEATVPLVLAGESTGQAADLAQAAALVELLDEGRHFDIDDERANATLTDAGLDLLESRLGIGLYTSEGVAPLTRLNLALHARMLLQRDVDYLVVDGALQLIDEGKGRVARLRRWPDGLHAAVEAKEGLELSRAGEVLDSLTVSDLISAYRSVAGMSGTVLAVREQLDEFSDLPSGRIERRLPDRRVDEPLRVFSDQTQKQEAVIGGVAERHDVGRPVLVGTQSVAESEELAAALRAGGVPVAVLNARNDAEEARIIAAAGEFGAVTISTQMSGRGTDIRLGGPEGEDHDRVAALGGLAVMSTSLFPSRRLDAQLRGRAARQGDPGSSSSFAALDDGIARTMAPPHLAREIEAAGERMAPARRAAILRDCQAIAEGVRLDRLRSTWGYSRAVVAQRAVVLAERALLLEGLPRSGRLSSPWSSAADALARLEVAVGPPAVRSAVRSIELFHLDRAWSDHLGLLAEVRDGIHLRALANLVPVDEFHRIALREFDGFFEHVSAEVAGAIEALEPEQLGRGEDALGLVRPSATWTYMVTDDPFGTPGDRINRRFGRAWRRMLSLE